MPLDGAVVSIASIRREDEGHGLIHVELYSNEVCVTLTVGPYLGAGVQEMVVSAKRGVE